jgi:hypothetical protein
MTCSNLFKNKFLTANLKISNPTHTIKQKVSEDVADHGLVNFLGGGSKRPAPTHVDIDGPNPPKNR